MIALPLPPDRGAEEEEGLHALAAVKKKRKAATDQASGDP